MTSLPVNLREAAQISEGEVRYLLHATITDSTNVILPHLPPVDVDLYFGNMFFMDRTDSESEFYYKPFEPRLITPLNITQTMFEPGKTGGIIRPTGGTISLSNSDGELDYLLDYSFDKKPISLYMLRGILENDTFADHFQIWGGVTLGVSATSSTIDIVVADRLSELEADFPPNIHTTGERIPITLGKVYNVEPLLIDEANNVYKVHDGAVTSIDAVYEGGEALTIGTSNDYYTDTGNGKITLTRAPTGVITADVTNTISGVSYPSGTSIQNTSGLIMRELLEEYGNITQLNGITFMEDDANQYEHGIYYSKKSTILDALSEMAESVGAVIYSNLFGNLELKIPEFPTTNPTTADPITDGEILDIQMLPTERFSGANVTVKYKRNYRPLNESELGASPADRDFVTREWRASSIAIVSATWGTGYSSLRDIEVNSTITNQTDADAEAIRLANFYTRDAKVFRVRMKTNPLYLEVGGAVELKSSRFGLTDSSGDGYPMLILSKFDDLQANEVTLELMGETN